MASSQGCVFPRRFKPSRNALTFCKQHPQVYLAMDKNDRNFRAYRTSEFQPKTDFIFISKLIATIFFLCSLISGNLLPTPHFFFLTTHLFNAKQINRIESSTTWAFYPYPILTQEQLLNAIGGEKEMTKTSLKILWSQTYSIDSIPIGGYVVPQRLCFFSLSFFFSFEMSFTFYPQTHKHTHKRQFKRIKKRNEKKIRWNFHHARDDKQTRQSESSLDSLKKKFVKQKTFSIRALLFQDGYERGEKKKHFSNGVACTRRISGHNRFSKMVLTRLIALALTTDNGTWTNRTR